MRKWILPVLSLTMVLIVVCVAGWKAYFSPQGLLGPSGVYKHNPKMYDRYEEFRIFRADETNLDPGSYEYLYEEQIGEGIPKALSEKEKKAWLENELERESLAIVELVITDCIGVDLDNKDVKLLYADSFLEARVTRVICQREKSNLRPGDMLAFQPKAAHVGEKGKYPSAIRPGDRYVMILGSYLRISNITMTQSIYEVIHAGYGDKSNDMFTIPMRFEGLQGYQPDMTQMAAWYEDDSMLTWKWNDLCAYFQKWMDEHLYIDYTRMLY